MAAKTKLVLVPGLLCTTALWGPQIAALGDVADISVANHRRHRTMRGIARSILTVAPRRFALAGLSMGGYIAYEIVRQAPERVEKLALLDTGSRADAPERKTRRLELIALAEREGAGAAQDALMSALIHKSRLKEKPLVDTIRQMAVDTGVAAFKRQQAAIMGRPDNRPLLARILLPDPGPSRARGCADPRGAGAGDRRRHTWREADDRAGLRPSLHPGAAGGREPRPAPVADAVVRFQVPGSRFQV